MRTVIPSEHDEQVALFEWAYLAQGRWPELAMLYAIPNGGHRHKAVAAKMKAEGVKAGVLDICLPVPRGQYHGLYVEMKKQKGGRLSDAQKWWKNMLLSQGYQVKVCHGADQGIDAIGEYLCFGKFGTGDPPVSG